MEFDGEDSRVEINNINLENNFTIMLDYKSEDTNGTGELINIGGNFTLMTHIISILRKRKGSVFLCLKPMVVRPAVRSSFQLNHPCFNP